MPPLHPRLLFADISVGKSPLPSGMPTSRSRQFATRLWMTAIPQPCPKPSVRSLATLRVHPCGLPCSEQFSILICWRFLWKKPEIMELVTNLKKKKSLRTTSPGHKTEVSKDSANLSRVELKLYLWVFKLGPVMAGVPNLLFQIILVNQTMSANYPGKES